MTRLSHSHFYFLCFLRSTGCGGHLESKKFFCSKIYFADLIFVQMTHKKALIQSRVAFGGPLELGWLQKGTSCWCASNDVFLKVSSKWIPWFRRNSANTQKWPQVKPAWPISCWGTFSDSFLSVSVKSVCCWMRQFVTAVHTEKPNLYYLSLSGPDIVSLWEIQMSSQCN